MGQINLRFPEASPRSPRDGSERISNNLIGVKESERESVNETCTTELEPPCLQTLSLPTFLITYISRSQAPAWECMAGGSASGLVLELEAGASQSAFPGRARERVPGDSSLYQAGVKSIICSWPRAQARLTRAALISLSIDSAKSDPKNIKQL